MLVLGTFRPSWNTFLSAMFSTLISSARNLETCRALLRKRQET
jgi:hypothetical protein